jgi:hypothetical protein
MAAVEPRGKATTIQLEKLSHSSLKDPYLETSEVRLESESTKFTKSLSIFSSVWMT